MSVIAAKTAMRDLAAKAAATVANTTLTNTQKATILGKIDVDLKGYAAEVSTHEYASRLAGGGESMQSYAGIFSTGPALGNAPSLMPSEDQLRGLHDAVRSHKSYKVEVGLKGVGDYMPDTLIAGVVGPSHEPTRILDLLPSSTMSTPVVEYIRHNSTTGVAGMVAAGALKPSVTLNTEKVEARARKIAVTTSLNDEDVEDFAAWAAYVSAELGRLVVDAENLGLLLGDGVGENLLGIFTTPGILTRVKGADPETGIDTLALAASDLRTGPALVPATVFAMSPNTWTKLTLLKDLQGRYVLGDPAGQDGAKLWGVPVVQSTGITAGWVLGMNGPDVGAAYVRKGLSIETDFGADGFEHNTTVVRAEERIALAVVKPSAAIKVTGLV